MSSLWVKINYVVVSSILKGLKGHIRLLEVNLEKAVRDRKFETHICTKEGCPNKTNKENE